MPLRVAALRPSCSHRKLSRSSFPGELLPNHSPTGGPKGSFTLPSTAMETNSPEDRATTKRSVCEGRLPPGSGTWCSGKAYRSSMPLKRGTSDLAKTFCTQPGKPSASSQQYASALAEYPFFHCFSGSARNCFQSSGPLEGIYILFIGSTSDLPPLRVPVFKLVL